MGSRLENILSLCFLVYSACMLIYFIDIYLNIVQCKILNATTSFRQVLMTIHIYFSVSF